jgi:hypothetical protein
MMDKPIEDDRLRQRLDRYMRTLAQAGVPAEFLAVCAAEFIMQQTNPDRRYSGC